MAEVRVIEVRDIGLKHDRLRVRRAISVGERAKGPTLLAFGAPSAESTAPAGGKDEGGRGEEHAQVRGRGREKRRKGRR